MHDQTTQVDDLRLVVLPSAVGCAELFVRFTLTEWQLRSLLDDAAMTARRLVSAVVDSMGTSTPPATFTLRLRVSSGLLAIELVVDRPVPRLTVPAGLPSRDNGARAVPGGQLMWCQLPLPTGMHAGAVALPRRGAGRAAARNASPPTAEVEPADVDLDVMRRILTSLNRKADRPID